MPLWFINPSRKRKMKRNPYGKCPKCRVILTPSGRVCFACKWRGKKNPKSRKTGKQIRTKAGRFKRQSYRSFIKRTKTGQFSKNPHKKGKKMARRLSLKRLIARARRRLRKNPYVGRGKNRHWKKRTGKSLMKALKRRYAREYARKYKRKASKRRVKSYLKRVRRRVGVRKAVKTRKARRAAGYYQKRKRRKASKRAKSRKSAKRSRAGKKAARTRARKKAARRRAARKAARKRARKQSRRRGGRKMARKYRKLKHGRRTKKRHGRGVRALARGRRSIRYARKHGSGAAKRFLKRFRMRSNPLGMIKDVMANVLPLAAGFFASRFASAKVPSLPYVGDLIGKLGSVAPVVVAGGVLVGAHYLTKKIGKLAKYRTGIMSGAGLNLLFTAIDSFAPASVKGFLGMGDEGVYDEALGAYTSDVAGYEEVNGYESVEGYEEVGAMQELAAEEELGGWADGLTAGVASAKRLRALPARSMVSDVPGFGAGKLYTGVFASGGKGWGE